MRKTWIGVVALAVVVLLLAGCVGVNNPLFRYDITYNSAEREDDSVILRGTIENTSLSNTKPVDVAIWVTLLDAEGTTLTSPRREAEGDQGPLALTNLYPGDKVSFTAIVPYDESWDGESWDARAERVSR